MNYPELTENEINAWKETAYRATAMVGFILASENSKSDSEKAINMQTAIAASNSQHRKITQLLSEIKTQNFHVFGGKEVNLARPALPSPSEQQ